MDRISLTWLIYGVIAACIGIATTTNMLSTKISTTLLSIYAIIGIILVFTVKNKKENYTNLIEKYEDYTIKNQNQNQNQHQKKIGLICL